MPHKWETPHQGKSITTWIRRGLLLREGETYREIYSFVMGIDNCNLCKVKFNDQVRCEWRCMDHDHATGFFRQVLCHKCNKQFDKKVKSVQKNSKTGHKWITPTHSKSNKGIIHVTFQYGRAGFKRKANKSLTTMIAYSFINLLKKPI